MSKAAYYDRLRILLAKKNIEMGVRAKLSNETFEKYIVSEVHDNSIKAISVQLKEINGELPFDESNYNSFSELNEDWIINVSLYYKENICSSLLRTCHTAVLNS